MRSYRIFVTVVSWLSVLTLYSRCLSQPAPSTRPSDIGFSGKPEHKTRRTVEVIRGGSSSSVTFEVIRSYSNELMTGAME